MSTFIVTGNYSSGSMQGMLAQPSDREAAVRPLIEGAGGKLLSYYATTGDSDFCMVMETDDMEGFLAALMVAGASESVTSLKTVQAFTSAEFFAAQKRASAMASAYKAPG